MAIEGIEGIEDQNTCDYCGEPVEDKYRLTCPECGRAGCPECIPGGRGCICPECEEAPG